jgi:hypothetical protein
LGVFLLWPDELRFHPGVQITTPESQQLAGSKKRWTFALALPGSERGLRHPKILASLLKTQNAVFDCLHFSPI